LITLLHNAVRKFGTFSLRHPAFKTQATNTSTTTNYCAYRVRRVALQHEVGNTDHRE